MRTIDVLFAILRMLIGEKRTKKNMKQILKYIRTKDIIKINNFIKASSIVLGEKI